MQENEEEMAIPSSNLNTEPPITKDVNDGDFQGTSNSVVTNSQNTNSTGCGSLFSSYFLYSKCVGYSPTCDKKF